MEHTQENIERIADKIIDGLELEDLIQWVKDDLCNVMLEKEIFDLNVESLCCCPSVACPIHGLPPGSSSGGW